MNIKEVNEYVHKNISHSLTKINGISTSSNHVFWRAIWDKLRKCIFENYEIAQVKRGQFQNFQKSRV